VLLVLGIVPLCERALLGQFAAGVNLVEVYASVTDSRGEPVAELSATDFVVEEDGVPQNVTTVAGGEFPLAVALGVDRSFSVSRDRLRDVVNAARGFVAALRPADLVMVVAIGSETEVVAPMSSDRCATLVALDRLEPWGTTPLFDATRAAIDAVEPFSGRRALILMSDGTDRYSDTTASEIVDYARHRNVMIYPIAIGGTRPPVFAELATVSGGRSFQSTTAAALSTTLSSIARELRFQYLLGYVPAKSAAEHGEWHSISVRVNRPNARVRAREGYFAH
jgi:Ca-activated chloride channel family protein